MKRTVLTYVLMAGFMLSCLDDTDCTIDSTNIVNIDFKKKDSFESDTLNIVKMEIDGSDSVFYENVTLTSFSLPLNTNTDNLPVTINLENGSLLQLTLSYTAVPLLISEECGIKFKIERLTVGDHNFDSVAIINPALEEEIITNIELYQ